MKTISRQSSAGGMALPRTGDEATPERAEGWFDAVAGQFGVRQLVSEYLIPVETNVLWYTLGGVLAVALVLEALTGVLLTVAYRPDAGQAYDITRSLMQTPVWSVILGFHFWNAIAVFALVMLHLMRVFITGAYREGKTGLWLTGVALAGVVLVMSLTGESLHWDEVGFAVPWHISEFFQAIGLASAFAYTFAELRAIPTATVKLDQLYAVHVSLAPMLLVLLGVFHFYLIKVKGISFPFWLKPSGRKAPFSGHIKEWMIYGGAVAAVLVLIALFVPRDPGTAPQLLPTSPFFGAPHGPGSLGAKPTAAISWTHGMNVFVGEYLGVEPDIWGTVFGMALMTLALLAVPFVDRGRLVPKGLAEALDIRQRGWAFLAIALFWLVLIVGSVTNFFALPG